MNFLYSRFSEGTVPLRIVLALQKAHTAFNVTFPQGQVRYWFVQSNWVLHENKQNPEVRSSPECRMSLVGSDMTAATR